MKTSKTSRLAPLLLASAVYLTANPPGHAAPLAFEDFSSYSAGGVNGLNGGTGWAGAWNAAATGVTVSTTESITYNLGGDILGGGNSVRVSGADNNNILGRNVFGSLNTTGQDYYVSLIFQVRGGTPGTPIANAYTGWQARDSAPSPTVDNIGTLGFNNRAGARVNNLTTSVTGTPGVLNFDTSYFAVMEFTGWNGSAYTTTTLWLNPAVGDEFTTDTTIKATQSSSTGSAGLLGLQVRSVGLADADYFLFDDIAVGTSWSAVVPEPGTAGLLLGGLCFLAFRRRGRTLR